MNNNFIRISFQIPIKHLNLYPCMREILHETET